MKKETVFHGRMRVGGRPVTERGNVAGCNTHGKKNEVGRGEPLLSDEGPRGGVGHDMVKKRGVSSHSDVDTVWRGRSGTS